MTKPDFPTTAKPGKVFDDVCNTLCMCMLWLLAEIDKRTQPCQTCKPTISAIDEQHRARVVALLEEETKTARDCLDWYLDVAIAMDDAALCPNCKQQISQCYRDFFFGVDFAFGATSGKNPFMELLANVMPDDILNAKSFKEAKARRRELDRKGRPK